MTDREKNANETKWAPIVHSRTYKVDFRSNMLVIPEDFSEEAELDWARRHIVGSMLAPEHIAENGVRWSVFQNRKHRVAGITCWGRSISPDMNADIHSRPIYLFLGYVCRPNAEGFFEDLPLMEIQQFAPLYDWVRRRWNEEFAYQYNETLTGDYEYKVACVEVLPDTVPFNFNEGVQVLCPDDIKKILWNFIPSSCRENKPFSICLGLEHKASIFQSPFLNADCVEVSHEETHPRTVTSPRDTHSQRRGGDVSSKNKAGSAQKTKSRKDSRDGYSRRDDDPENYEKKKSSNSICGMLSGGLSSLSDLVFGASDTPEESRKEDVLGKERKKAGDKKQPGKTTGFDNVFTVKKKNADQPTETQNLTENKESSGKPQQSKSRGAFSYRKKAKDSITEKASEEPSAPENEADLPGASDQLK